MEITPQLDILIVDDEASIRKTLSLCLMDEGHRTVAVSNAEDALREAGSRVLDVIFLDLKLGNASGIDLIPQLKRLSPEASIIVITAFAGIESAVESIRRGATDYLPKPFSPAQVMLSIHRMVKFRMLQRQVSELREQAGQADYFLTSKSPIMQRVLAMARSAASSDATILLTGESGTGKTALARAVHAWSPRAQRAFAVVSCPSFSAELLESELFGHVKGAFTSAVRDNPGRVSQAHGGSLFLDEIGDLPLPLQPKFLRFLQDREYERVGDVRTLQADVRIIAATNQDLEQAVREGRFREDLFYRLNVIGITMPALRDRREDIPELARHILAKVSDRLQRKVLGFTPEAESALMAHDWPGNIRELHNVLERAVVFASGELIESADLPFSAPIPSGEPPRAGDAVTIAELEEAHIRRVLATSRSFEEAAETLGIDQTTLWRRRKQYGI